MSTRLLRPQSRVEISGAVVDVDDGTIGLDDNWSPYLQGELTIDLAAQPIADAIDPRQALRAIVTSTVSGNERVFDLGIRSRSYDPATLTMSLTVASDEALVQDYAPLADDSTPRDHESSLRAVINHVLGQIDAELEAGADDADVTAWWPVTNRVTNPSAESVAGFAVASNATALGTNTAAPFDGAAYVRWNSGSSGGSSIRVTVDGSVTPGEPFIATAHARSSVAGLLMRVLVRFFDSDGGTLIDVNGPQLAAPASPGWQEISAQGIVPPGARGIGFFIVANATAAGQTFAVDGLMLYDDDERVPFFSGSTPDDEHYTYGWSSTVNGSASTRTPIVERLRENLVWPAGVSGWDFLQPLVTSVGLRLFCDERRVWRLVGTDYGVPGVVAAVASNMTGGEDTISREQVQLWAEGVVVRYRWTSRDGISHERTDTAGVPGRVLVVDYARPFPGPGAAATILRVMHARGRVQQMTMLTDLRATPGMESRISLPGAAQLVGTLRAVEYELTTGLMRIESRMQTDMPTDAWGAEPATEAWDAQPATEAWIP